MWESIINRGNNLFIVLALLAFISTPLVHAEEDDSSSPSTASAGHWYLGASTAYLKPDSSRLAGNTRTVGVQAGYQLNNNWAVEGGYQTSAGRYDFGPWGARTTIYDAQLVRFWGDKYRFLAEFGVTHITMDGGSVDDTTHGFHLGVGLSTFVTPNLELRGDAKGIFSPDETRVDSIGTLSLNWHFINASSAKEESTSALGDTTTEESQSLPPVSYREPAEAEEAAAAPVEEAAPPAAVEAAPAQQTVAPVVAAPAQAVAAPTPAVPKSTHTLVNFDTNSSDVGGKYGGQLDQIAQDIRSTHSKAVVTGYTDNVGKAEVNKVLSLDRAIVVKRELKNRGVSGDSLKVVGKGEENPVASNASAEGRAKNRRVEIQVYDNP